MRAAKPLIRGRSVSLGSLRSACGSSYLIGILHTEIAKVAKIDLELGDPLIRGWSVLCDLRVDRLI
jgi:hypothetical protein